MRPRSLTAMWPAAGPFSCSIATVVMHPSQLVWWKGRRARIVLGLGVGPTGPSHNALWAGCWQAPTLAPSSLPTVQPSSLPTSLPTKAPTVAPSASPTTVTQVRRHRVGGGRCPPASG